jgi:hypothetical protein
MRIKRLQPPPDFREAIEVRQEAARVREEASEIRKYAQKVRLEMRKAIELSKQARLERTGKLQDKLKI